MSDTAEKVVLITGAAGGLGRATVATFLHAGWRVLAASRQAAEWTPHERLVPLELDATDSAAVDSVLRDALARFGRLDCLINNAGVVADRLCAQMSDDEWDRVLDVNLKGAFRCARAAARPMAKQRGGHIINISSHAARAGARGQANYAAAKAGIIGLTQSLAKELGSRNVRVNAVLPGVLPTKMTAALAPEQLDAFAQANALGRINDCDEVARFILFLAGTRNISGQVFPLDSRIAPWT
jgi:3-oxoacyl-[acyl-carrier protein] reductase